MEMEVDHETARDPDNDPPYSRIFVICAKNTTEEQLTQLSSSFGKVE
jgi:hypothetical protein